MLPAHMKAVVFDEFGPPSVLQYRTVPLRPPGPGEVTIEVRAVSINRTLDLAVRANGDGRGVTLPLVLGVDPSGVVCELGPGVSSVAVGDRVTVVGVRCGSCPSCLAGDDCENRFHLGVDRWGGYAQFVTTPAWTLTLIPDDVGFAEATVIFRHYPTAHHLLHTVAGIRPGEIALVLGSAGGLGSACVEVATSLGASVIAGAGSPDRVAAGCSLGARFGINYREEDLGIRVQEITAGRGVDIVVDNIGDPAIWPAAFASLGHHGRLVTAGAHGGGIVSLDLRRLYRYHLRVLGSSGRGQEDLDWVTQESGRFRPLIGARLPLDEAVHAHELVAENRVVGKVVLDPTLKAGDGAQSA